MKFSTLLRLIRFWPPFLGAGIRVTQFNDDGSLVKIKMKLRFWNKNYVGTHFGGSLYTMTDPFYMLMLINLLGKDYIVWDKSASIRYKIPARGSVFATFKISVEQIQQIKHDLTKQDKLEPQFTVSVVNEQGEVVAEVKKVLHISKKHRG